MKQSVENVTQLIHETSKEVTIAVENNEKMVTYVSEGNKSMQQTDGVFDQILVAMNENSEQAQKMVNDIEDFTRVITEIGVASQRVAESAGSLKVTSEDF